MIKRGYFRDLISLSNWYKNKQEKSNESNYLGRKIIPSWKSPRRADGNFEYTDFETNSYYKENYIIECLNGKATCTPKKGSEAIWFKTSCHRTAHSHFGIFDRSTDFRFIF